MSNFEQASQLLFCSVMLKETLRLHPPAPKIMLHSTVSRRRTFCRQPASFSVGTSTTARGP